MGNEQYTTQINNLRLKELRKKSKLTQEQMAQYLEVDQSMIARLENGNRHLNINILEKLCNLFGCSPEYLLGNRKDEEYLQLNFAFHPNKIQSEDLESITAFNKIVMNLRRLTRES